MSHTRLSFLVLLLVLALSQSTSCADTKAHQASVNDHIQTNLSSHFTSFCATLYLFVCVLFAIKNGNCFVFLQAYGVYLLCAFVFSDTFGYVGPGMPISKYEENYDLLVQSAPYFELSIECYHKDGDEDDVTTHKASTNYYPNDWKDESDPFKSIQIPEDRDYALVNFNSSYFFSTKEAERQYKAAKDTFYKENTRDKKQRKKELLVVPGLKGELAFRATGAEPIQTSRYVLFSLLGLNYPYCAYLEQLVVRHKVDVIKRII